MLIFMKFLNMVEFGSNWAKMLYEQQLRFCADILIGHREGEIWRLFVRDLTCMSLRMSWKELRFQGRLRRWIWLAIVRSSGSR